MPVRQDDDEFTIVPEGLAGLGFDHDRAIDPGLFLQARMTVIPVGPALLGGKAIGMGGAGPDAAEADAGHAVLSERHDKAVPMDGCVHVQRVGDVDGDVFAFPEAKHGAGDGAVDRQPRAFSPGYVYGLFADGQVIGARIGQRGRKE